MLSVRRYLNSTKGTTVESNVVPVTSPLRAWFVRWLSAVGP